MKVLKDFKGEYLGHSPTDESAMGFGELQVTVDDSCIRGRHAAGLKIYDLHVELTDLELMTPEEIAPHDPSGVGSEVAGFRHKNGMEYLFVLKPRLLEFDIMIRGNELADLLGPTILYKRERVSCFLFKFTLWYFEWRTKGGIPRLRYGGKARAYSKVS